MEDDEDSSALLFCDPGLSASIVRQIERELSNDTRKSGNGAAAGCGVGCLAASVASIALGALGVTSGWAGLLAVVIWIGVAALIMQDKHSMRTAQRYADRYVDAEKFDAASVLLMNQVVTAIGIIENSRVNSEGFLDGIANDIVLPQQMWEIAKVLKIQTELRAEQAEAKKSLMTEELSAVLAPQQRALKQSVAAIKQRIERLESYAAQVRSADSALEARARLKDNDKYRELLAHTDDGAALASLDSQATQIEEKLRTNIQKALLAGEELAM